MAAATSAPLSISSTSTFADGRAPRQSAALAASPQCLTQLPLPTAPPHHHHLVPQSRAAKATAYCRKIGRGVVAMATGEAPAEIAAAELPDVVKTIQEAWDKVEDKYAVTSLAFALSVGIYASSGLVSALDRLPLVPGVLELVGIGYTGWFAYKNLVFKPDREALIRKIKELYGEVLGTSS